MSSTSTVDVSSLFSSKAVIPVATVTAAVAPPVVPERVVDTAASETVGSGRLTTTAGASLTGTSTGVSLTIGLTRGFSGSTTAETSLVIVLGFVSLLLALTED